VDSEVHQKILLVLNIESQCFIARSPVRQHCTSGQFPLLATGETRLVPSNDDGLLRGFVVVSFTK
jgi:hypothetical protein